MKLLNKHTICLFIIKVLTCDKLNHTNDVGNQNAVVLSNHSIMEHPEHFSDHTHIVIDQPLFFFIFHIS